MDGLNFNQEWYGTQAKVLTQTSDSIVVANCNNKLDTPW